MGRTQWAHLSTETSRYKLGGKERGEGGGKNKCCPLNDTAGKLRAGWASHQVLVVLQDSLLVASLLQHSQTFFIVVQGPKSMASAAILKSRPIVSFLLFPIHQSKSKSQQKLKGRGKGLPLLMEEEVCTAKIGMSLLAIIFTDQLLLKRCLLFFSLFSFPVLMISKTFTSFQSHNYIQASLEA